MFGRGGALISLHELGIATMSWSWNSRLLANGQQVDSDPSWRRGKRMRRCDDRAAQRTGSVGSCDCWNCRCGRAPIGCPGVTVRWSARRNSVVWHDAWVVKRAVV